MGSNDGDAMQWAILYIGSVVGEAWPRTLFPIENTALYFWPINIKQEIMCFF